jgi:hypothetical protein
LVLFFGGFEMAARDLLGSAAARMGSEAAGAINPEYARFLREGGRRMAFREGYSEFSPAAAGIADVQNTRLLAKMLALFLQRSVSGWMIGLGGLVAISIMVLDLRAARLRGLLVRRHLSRLALVGGVAIGGAIVASVAWMLLVPRHAVFHFHILPRHFLVGLALLALLPVGLGWLRCSAGTELKPFLRNAWVPVVVNSVPLLILGVASAYTLLAYG